MKGKATLLSYRRLLKLPKGTTCPDRVSVRAKGITALGKFLSCKGQRPSRRPSMENLRAAAGPVGRRSPCDAPMAMHLGGVGVPWRSHRSPRYLWRCTWGAWAAVVLTVGLGLPGGLGAWTDAHHVDDHQAMLTRLLLLLTRPMHTRRCTPGCCSPVSDTDAKRDKQVFWRISQTRRARMPRDGRSRIEATGGAPESALYQHAGGGGAGGRAMTAALACLADADPQRKII